jgi:hypothetical protein
MSDAEDYANKLAKWHEEDTHNILNILLRIQGLKDDTTEKDATKVLDALMAFHKQANRAPEEQVCEDWFKEIIKCKNHVKGLLETIKKNSIKKEKKVKNIN